jgi:hypothetical protein
MINFIRKLSGPRLIKNLHKRYAVSDALAYVMRVLFGGDLFADVVQRRRRPHHSALSYSKATDPRSRLTALGEPKTIALFSISMIQIIG